jgi:hypothetical protein
MSPRLCACGEPYLGLFSDLPIIAHFLECPRSVKGHVVGGVLADALLGLELRLVLFAGAVLLRDKFDPQAPLPGGHHKRGADIV